MSETNQVDTNIAADVAASIEAQAQPPIDNDHVAEGCEKFDEATIAANAMQTNTVAAITAQTTPTTVNSTSDERVINNVMRHAYKVLSDEEKAAMQKVKDLGLDFHTFLETLPGSRELSVAKTKIEEAVMWAVKHITN